MSNEIYRGGLQSIFYKRGGGGYVKGNKQVLK